MYYYLYYLTRPFFDGCFLFLLGWCSDEYGHATSNYYELLSALPHYSIYEIKSTDLHTCRLGFGLIIFGAKGPVSGGFFVF